MQETETILQRIRELSIQASNDTNSADDRANLNAEVQSLLTEIDRISSSTTWAGQSLLDGTFTDKSFQVGTDTMVADQLVTSIAGTSVADLGLGGSTIQSISDVQSVTSSTFNSISVTDPTTIANSSNSKPGINHFSAEPNGDGFLLSWTTVPYGGGSGGIYIQKTDSAGISVGSPIAIDTEGEVNHTHSVQLDNGNTAFTYMKYSAGRYNTKVLLLDSDLNILSNTTANSGEPTGDYHNGRIENLGNSKFIVKWDYNPNHPQLDARGSKAQIFNYDGTKNGSSFAVSSDAATYSAPEIAAFDDTHLAALVVNRTNGDRQVHLRVYDLDDKSNLNSILISDGGDDDTIGSYQVTKTPAGFAVSWTEGSADKGYVQFFDKTGVATTSKIKIGENITTISEIVTKAEADGSIVAEVFWGSTDNGSAVTNYSRLTDYDANSLVSKESTISGYNGVMIPGTAANGNYVLFNNESYDDPVRAFNVDVTIDHSLATTSSLVTTTTIGSTSIDEATPPKRINITDEAFNEIIALDHGGFAVLSETNSSSKTVFYDNNGDILKSVETEDTMGNGIWLSDEGLIVVNNMEHYSHTGVLVKTELIAHETMSASENSSAISRGTLRAQALTDNFYLSFNNSGPAFTLMDMGGENYDLAYPEPYADLGFSAFAGSTNAEDNNFLYPLGGDKILVISTGTPGHTPLPIGDTIAGGVYEINRDANGQPSSFSLLGSPFSIDRGETQDQNIDVQQINDDEFVLVYSAKSDTVTSTETQEGMNGQNVRAQLINLDDGLVGNYLRISSPTDTTGIENDETNPLVTKLTNGDIGVIWNGYGIYNDNGSYSYETYFQALRPSSFNILLTNNARSAITLVDTALQSLNSQRASLGAISNRLDHIVANNTNAATNVSKSLGRIQDADFAAESTSLAKNQILQQASTAMLAQANASKQNILELLQS
jgi:flagellin-like hook-associated protein FlgL